MKYVLSFGGGINSSALFFYILSKKMPLDVVIFADTGEEEEHTLKSVEALKNICSKKNIDFVTVRSKLGNLYEHYYKKKVVMSMMKRDCTGKFKISPIRKYLRETFGKQETFTMYIGIAFDEAHRIRDSDVKYIKNSYPFVYDKINRDGNSLILRQNSFVASKSGCKGCMYNKKKNWIKMIVENPKEFMRHLVLEENNSGYPRVLLNGTYSLRSLYDSYKNQRSLLDFDDVEATCDVAGSCFL